jgi:hypothetical protein
VKVYQGEYPDEDDEAVAVPPKKYAGDRPAAPTVKHHIGDADIGDPENELPVHPTNPPRPFDGSQVIKGAQGARAGEGTYARNAAGGWTQTEVAEAEDFTHTAKLGKRYRGEDVEAKFRGGHRRDAAGNIKKEVTTQYLRTDAERARLAVGADDQGRLQNAAGEALDTAGSAGLLKGSEADRMIFAMNQKGSVLAADPGQETHRASTAKKRDWFHHSSFFAGADVAAAGEVATNKEGWVKTISNESGHYTPDAKNTLQAVEGLDRMGANLDAANVEIYGQGRHNAGMFMQSQANIPLLQQRANVMAQIRERKAAGPLDYAEHFSD